ENQQRWSLPCERLQETPHRSEQVLSLLDSVVGQPRDDRKMRGHTRLVAVSEQRTQSASQLRHRLRGRIAGKDGARLLDDQRERAIRDALSIREGAPAEHKSAFGLNLARQLERQPRLADPGSAHDGDQLWIA